MAGENRTTDHPLIARMEREASSFSFFQAVQLLQRAVPGSPRVGYQGPVDQESIRFQPELSFGFSPSDLAGIRRSDPSAGAVRYVITTTFLSLYGTNSPLPTYFTEQLMEQEEESLQREFLDLFHHRLLSLLFRVWEKYRYSAQFSEDGKDLFSHRLLELLIGNPDRFPADHHVRPVRLLALGGLFTQIPRSAASLAAGLSEYFNGIPVDVESCVPRWLPIPEDQQNRLAASNCRLGSDLSLGERVMDRACTFRISLGPLGLEEFMSFLPSGGYVSELREIVDLMNGDALDFEVELCLREDEIPPLQLSSDRVLLGWSTWLGRRQGMQTRVRFLVKGWLHGRG